MTPVRVQRRRTKGFRLQDASPNGLPVVSVTRPGQYGNPFPVKQYGKTSLILFASNLKIILAVRPDFLTPLRGKNLACWCSINSPCHADILLKMANREEKE